MLDGFLIYGSLTDISSLTSKSLSGLASHFEKELQRKPNETGAEMDKRYKQSLDSVRVRQRNFFRFSKALSQRFENSTEYNINLKPREVRSRFEALIESGHVLVDTAGKEDGIYLIASLSLLNRQNDIQSILGTCS